MNIELQEGHLLKMTAEIRAWGSRELLAIAGDLVVIRSVRTAMGSDDVTALLVRKVPFAHQHADSFLIKPADATTALTADDYVRTASPEIQGIITGLQKRIKALEKQIDDLRTADGPASGWN